tara:strand:- start:2031 stop:2156 length:126 start_codon:yes stop_codon:yes gene_type:complete
MDQMMGCYHLEHLDQKKKKGKKIKKLYQKIGEIYDQEKSIV